MGNNTQKKLNFWASAVPLVTVDPYFSIWSFSDTLNGDVTRHWTGKENRMNAGVIIDGTYYSLMGRFHSDSRQKFGGIKNVSQKSVHIGPLITSYEFENDILYARLEFITPLLLRNLDIFSRPLSYIEYDIQVKDENIGKADFYFDIFPECCVNDWTQEVLLEKSEFGVFCGNKEQNILGRSGDNVCIDWGYLHLIHKDAEFINRKIDMYKRVFVSEVANTKGRSYNAFNEAPVMAVITDDVKGVIALAYDDRKSIEYFGEWLDDYYKEKDGTFNEMVRKAVSEYADVKEKCISFSNELQREALQVSEEYEKIVSLVYRQVIAAHKLVRDKNGDILFVSKECFSNGCAATLDVSYPSIPMFLKYNPELVAGMLRPIIRVARSKEWGDREFAPHDAGRYPCLNGQQYEKNNPDTDDEQMPVEECGNMLVITAALCKATGKNNIAYENRDLLKKWADYLVKNGYDPGNQLCTDDFAGKWPHNCNLSIKAIVAIGAYGKIFSDSHYSKIANEYAAKWIKDTKAQTGTLLAFDKKDTWSIKYNIIWDKYLGLGLFSDGIYKKEVEAYKKKMRRYGVPLDCRSDYAKLDWMAWTTIMTDDAEYTKDVYRRMYNYINETVDRVPVSDWFSADSGRQYVFQNRSVLGALFINIMDTHN